MDHETIELACIGVGALALLIQALVLLGIYAGISKATKSIKEEIDDLRSSVTPILATTRELAETTRQVVVRLTPKVEQTVTDVAELTRGLRAASSGSGSGNGRDSGPGAQANKPHRRYVFRHPGRRGQGEHFCDRDGGQASASAFRASGQRQGYCGVAASLRSFEPRAEASRR